MDFPLSKDKDLDMDQGMKSSDPVCGTKSILEDVSVWRWQVGEGGYILVSHLSFLTIRFAVYLTHMVNLFDGDIYNGSLPFLK